MPISALAIAGVASYAVTKSTNHSGFNNIIMQNVEALTNFENNDPRYPKKEGKAQFCKLYIYMKAGVVVSTSEEPNASLEVSGDFTKEVREGLKDRCPDKGEGCNPYSCQEIPY